MFVFPEIVLVVQSGIRAFASVCSKSARSSSVRGRRLGGSLRLNIRSDWEIYASSSDFNSKQRWAGQDTSTFSPTEGTRLVTASLTRIDSLGRAAQVTVQPSP